MYASICIYTHRDTHAFYAEWNEWQQWYQEQDKRIKIVLLL